MTAITHHRKDLMIEADYLPADLGDLLDLRPRLVELIGSGRCTDAKPSAANTVADGIIGWLVAKAAGETESVSGPTRSRYRRILAQLATHEGGGGGQRGSTTLAGTFLALVGGAATVAAASGRPVAMAIASPIIYDESGYVGCGERAA